MGVRTWLAALGVTFAGLGCGSDGARGSEGLQGPQGPPGPSGTAWEVGEGLTLEGNVLSVRYDGANAPVPSSDPRLSDARAPLAGSAHYVQNSTAVQPGSFALTGSGTTHGPLSTRSDLLVDAASTVESPMALLKVQNTTSAGASWKQFPVFTVDSAGGLVASGEVDKGLLPVSGTGTRLMWAPGFAAFRAGYTETQWDDGSVGDFSWAGGYRSLAKGAASFAMGKDNVARGDSSIALGSGNTTSEVGGIALGSGNNVTGLSAIGFGTSNTVSGRGAVAMGASLQATGNYSFAFGQDVSTNGKTGAFIWGDRSGVSTASIANDNQFMVRAAGGVMFYTSANLGSRCELRTNSAGWECSSDRDLKEDFRQVDGEALLTKVAGLPITTWRFKGEAPQVRHLGPVAQDFHAAFGLGAGDKTIGQLDMDGVNLAAIQALEVRTRELREKTAEVDALKSELAELKRGLSRLEAAIQAKDSRH